MSRSVLSRRRVVAALCAFALLPATAAGTAFAAAPRDSGSHSTSAGGPVAVKRPLHVTATRGGKASASLAARSAVGAPRDSGDAWSLDNGLLDVDISSDGRFTAGSDGASGYELLFGWPDDPRTSFTSVRVDGIDVALPNADPTDNPPQAAPDVPASGGYDQRSWWVEGVVVTQTLSIVANSATGNNDALHVVWRLTSGDGAAHTASLRTLFDDDVNGSDGAVFHVPGYGEPSAETEFDGAQVPDRLTLYPNDADTQHVASAFLASGIDTRPDRLVIAHWPEAFDSTYDYTPDPTNLLAHDSAYLAYWQNRSVTAASSVAVATSYGVGHLISDIRPPLDVSIDAPSSYTAVPATSTEHAYSPDPMTVAISLTNSSPTSVEPDVHLQLLLPSGLTATWTSQQIGDLEPGDASYVSFGLHASGRPVAGPVVYTLRVFDAYGYKDVPVSVFVPAATLVPISYVALGDSYSAGEGTQAAGFVDSNNGHCNRTYAAYSNDITRPGDVQPLSAEAAQGFPGMGFVFAACSNAKIVDVESNAQNAYQSPQLTAVSGSTNLVTLTIGGNDVGFRDIIEACIAAPVDCADEGLSVTILGHTYRSPSLVSSTYDQIGKQKQRLIDLIHQIQSRAAPGVSILIAGYPQIFPATLQRTCGQSLDGHLLRVDELAFIRTATVRLDAVIQQAAAAAGAHYVDPNPEFDGHQLCGGGDDYFISALHSVTGGSSWTNSFHPTAEGQQAYAAAFNGWLAANGTGPLHSLAKAARSGGGVQPPPVVTTAAAKSGKTTTVGLQLEDATVTASGDSGTPACSSVTVGRAGSLTVDADGFAPGKPVRIDLLDAGRTATDVAPGAKADKSGHLHARVTVPDAAPYATAAGLQVLGLAPGGHSLVAAFGGFSVAKAATCKPLGQQVTGRLLLLGSSAQTATVRVDSARTTVHVGTDRALSLPVGTHTVTLLAAKHGHLVAVARLKLSITAGDPQVVEVTGAGAGSRLTRAVLPAALLTSSQSQVQTLAAPGAVPVQVSVGSSSARTAAVTTATGKPLTVRVWRADVLVATLHVTLRPRERLVVASLGSAGAPSVTKLTVTGQPRWS